MVDSNNHDIIKHVLVDGWYPSEEARIWYNLVQKVYPNLQLAFMAPADDDHPVCYAWSCKAVEITRPGYKYGCYSTNAYTATIHEWLLFKDPDSAFAGYLHFCFYYTMILITFNRKMRVVRNRLHYVDAIDEVEEGDQDVYGSGEYLGRNARPYVPGVSTFTETGLLNMLLHHVSQFKIQKGLTLQDCATYGYNEQDLRHVHLDI